MQIDGLHPRPEWQLGFKAMRRKEILDYARYHADKIGPVAENIGKDSLAAMMQAFVDQGKIPHPYTPPANPSALIEAQETRMAAMQAQIDALTKGGKRGADAA